MLTNTEIFHYPNKTDVISDAILITLLHHYLRPISNLCWKPIVKKANEIKHIPFSFDLPRVKKGLGGPWAWVQDGGFN